LDTRRALLAQLQDGGIYLPAICGGRGTCGKCKVKVIAGRLEPSAADIAYFSPADIAAGFRLSCKAYPAADITITIPQSREQEFQGVNSFTVGEQVINNSEVEVFTPEKNKLSFARQIAGDRPVTLEELERISVLADILGKPPLPDAGAGANTGAGADAGAANNGAAAGAAAAGGEGTPSGATAGARAQSGEAAYIYRDRGRVIAVRRKPEPLYAIAIDIGTTTIALALVNLQTGAITGRLSMVNKQREFGADVISRIQRANGGDLPRLCVSVRKQLAEGAAALCRNGGVGEQAVARIAIAGNTTMLHLLLGLSCACLGQSPFTPVTLDFVSFNYREIFAGDFSCEVVLLPGISTYVGADITAGLLFSEAYKAAAPVLFMDIGTNGEMALAVNGKLLCTATAAGPAFEGGNILWGTGSVPGAISKVKYASDRPLASGKPLGRFDIKTIDNRPPVGICGSAVVDIVYEGLQNGLIQSTGAFNKNRVNDALFIAKHEDGQDITFIQKDVRELQLAKSAICSGIDALLHHRGLAYDDIQTLFIAGGFGYNLDFESGAGIGLIPQALKPKVALIGNSALGGTVRFLLDRDNEALLAKIAQESEEYSLPEDRYFNDLFIDNIEFDGYE
jgi:uncharacterized 2Fe-2S/4Fe-4S cluster protein (DUF4445 family)